jgi:hypothetical protein
VKGLRDVLDVNELLLLKRKEAINEALIQNFPLPFSGQNRLALSLLMGKDFIAFGEKMTRDVHPSAMLHSVKGLPIFQTSAVTDVCVMPLMQGKAKQLVPPLSFIGEYGVPTKRFMLFHGELRSVVASVLCMTQRERHNGSKLVLLEFEELRPASRFRPTNIDSRRQSQRTERIKVETVQLVQQRRHELVPNKHFPRLQCHPLLLQSRNRVGVDGHGCARLIKDFLPV